MDLNELKLNPKQIEAVKSIDGSVLVVAGAGSGKTKVLTTRVSYLINDVGIDDNSILAITFTNAACLEMRNRIIDQLNRYTNTNILTYHALCLKILRVDIDKLGGNNNFRITDEEERISIINQIYKEWRLRDDFGKRCKSKLMLDFIDEFQAYNAKYANDLWSLGTSSLDSANNMVKRNYLFSTDIKYIEGIYKEYQKQKQKNNWLDFNDLIYSVYKLFHNSPNVAKKWSEKFKYILVDEFQDTDEFQFDILCKLVNNQQNIFAVGDPDQTIYEWRGAYSDIFNVYLKTFKNTKTIILDINYRSTQSILNVANSLIKHNHTRIDKTLVTVNGVGEKPIYYCGDTQHEEGKFIANKISELHDKYRIAYKNIAVLYRSNYLFKFIEDGLINTNIHYYIYGGVKFYQRKEIKDILAYLRMISHFNDELSILRVINIPQRGIGESTIDKIKQYAKVNHMEFIDALKLTKAINPNITWNDQVIYRFINLINQIKSASKDKTIVETVNQIIKLTNYEQYLNSFESTNEANSRMDNINELISSIKEFETNNKSASIDEFIQSIALYTDTSSNDVKNKQDHDNVSLMTVHFAKGTEYEAVFIAGLYEGVFPNSKSIGNRSEEERRIAFVGITRAKQYLFISSNIGKSFMGNNYPSSFINEMGKNNLERITSYYQSTSSADVEWYDSHKIENYENMYEEKQIQYSIGDTIVHTIFGQGVIVEINDGILGIVFKKPYGLKHIIATHKSLKLVKN
ncbi:MAG: UvrD-helicase domain-containing protein [Mycoplasma sp.]|nr:UvrD-helicase domain-containing protein [Mycoplasma sp.]